MAVVLLTVNKRMAEALGMSDGAATYGTFSGNTWKTADVDAAILAADGIVVAAILLTPGHGRRAGFEAASTTAHGDEIATHIGPVGAVTFSVTGGFYSGTRVGEQAPRQEIEIDNLNIQSLSLIPPKYAIEGERLFHNGAAMGGATVSVDICAYTRTAACQAPDETEDAVFHGAMFVIAKNGQHGEAASGYRQAFQQDLILLGVSPELAGALTMKLDERTSGGN